MSIELLNDATFLLESHVLQAEEATTPLRQLYFALQTLLMEPGHAGPARSLYAGLHAGLLAATRDAGLRAGLESVQSLVGAGRLFEALKLIRGLYPAEAALMAGEETGAGEGTGADAADAAPVTAGPRPKRPAELIETARRRRDAPATMPVSLPVPLTATLPNPSGRARPELTPDPKA